jgi:rSAM/selenodomain-associated transferase 1
MDKLKSKQNALIVFVKSPHLGQVKTRMQPELSTEVSLNLHKAMGRDLVDHFSQSQYFDFFIHFWPENARGEMQSWLGTNLNYIPQQGSDLGEKLKNSFSNAFQQNYQKVCIIGSDLPTLSEKNILVAFQKLESSNVVLGPTMDGGYYLVALKKYYPQIFDNIGWSTESVFKQTLLRTKQQNLSVFQMDIQQDIDIYEDVFYLWNEFLENENKLNREIPNTIIVLKGIFVESK